MPIIHPLTSQNHFALSFVLFALAGWRACSLSRVALSRVARSVVVITALLGSIASAEDAPAITLMPKDVDAAMRKGLALLDRAGPNWRKHKSCFSCHHQTLPMLAMTEASRAGSPLDEAWMTAQADFTHKYFEDHIKVMHAGEHVPGGSVTVSYGLWALSLANRPADETTAAMVGYLLKIQGVVRLKDPDTGETRAPKDGRWMTSCNRPPLQTSQIGMTVLALIGMQRYATAEQRPLLSAARDRAEKWLSQAPLQTQEDRIWRLWGIHQLDGDAGAKSLAATRANILAAQREDGGWSQTDNLASDAFSTGQTIFVLCQTGTSPRDPAVQRAAKFLLSTQHADGSWLVETRMKPVQTYFDNGDPHGKHQFLSTAATAWATAGLAQLLSDQPQAENSPRREKPASRLDPLFDGATARADDKPAARTILFVDDHDVLYRAGTRRVLNLPVRHAKNPLITEDKPWELAIGWTSVIRNVQTGKYQLWYQAYAGKRAQLKTHECVVCYAESDDGIAFTKPNLGLFDFNGDQQTNIVLLGSGVLGDRYCNSVIVDPRETDESRRYKMAFTDWSKDANGEVWVGMHVAFSPDGIRWTRHSESPRYRSYHGIKKVQPPFVGENPNHAITSPDGRVRHQARLPMTLSDACDVIFDPRRERFLIYGKMWIGGPDGGLGWKHGMGRSESQDFLNWSKPQLVCSPDDADGPLEFHTSPVFIHRERYFCLNQILNRAAGGVMDIELMVSRDGFEWQRPFRERYFIPRSPGEQFDSGTILTNANMIVHGDEMRIYYGAYSSGAIGGGTNITGDQQKSGVGLVTLPLDRFAGIRSEPELPTPKIKSPPNIGQITLKPLEFVGRSEILLNANATGGAVWGELLDEDGYRVPGFDKQNCRPLQTDSLRHSLAWKEKTLADLPSGRYHLRLHLEKAEVFAVTLK